ncbi:hypothetical protein AGLY_013157 [Aphis glycines]|uniref:Uncharacterized protein n=1 Tax=Aphis glycines TaxID=307491 RepID=A0A6G0T7M4_APHGL|nr:hypothetical protein AGLY_013157 [Aphis glycines]
MHKNKKKINLYLCYSPFHHRTTSHASTINFFKCIIRVIQISTMHFFTNIITKKNIFINILIFMIHFKMTYEIFSVLKLLTIELIKFSRMTTALIAFQSDAFSPSNKQIDSNANLTTAGGLAIDPSMTAGSTCARSAITSFRFSDINTCCALICACISCDCTLRFSASCCSLNICCNLALAASFLVFNSIDLTANDFCISSTCSTVSAIFDKPTFKWSCCSSSSALFSLCNFTK